MKKTVLCLLLLLFVPSLSPAQIYTAGTGYYQQEPSVIFPWETSFGAAGVFSPVKETGGERLFNFQGGATVRALYYVAPWAGFGLEGVWFVPAGGHTVIDKYQVMRGGIAGKFVAASETSVRSYGILGAGLGRRKAEYSFGWNEHKSFGYFAFGLGVETDVSDAAFIGAEARGIYNTSAALGRFASLVSRWESEVSVRLGFRF